MKDFTHWFVAGAGFIAGMAAPAFVLLPLYWMGRWHPRVLGGIVAVIVFGGVTVYVVRAVRDAQDRAEIRRIRAEIMATPRKVGEDLCPYETHAESGAEYEQCVDESEDKVRRNLSLPPREGKAP